MSAICDLLVLFLFVIDNYVHGDTRATSFAAIIIREDAFSESAKDFYGRRLS